MDIRIETGRLILRQFSLDDASDLHRICNEPYILKWMPDWKSSVEGMKGWIGWVNKRYTSSSKEAARIMLAVTLEGDGRLIGMVGIGNKEEVDNEVEIAYFISREFCSRGYMSEAAKAMVGWSFDSLKLDYLIAIVEPDNFPSQRVVEKSGFKLLETRMILNSGETEEKPFYYYRIYNTVIKF
jgi:[ribosomal protein S5]-alanine N-acetyltransferase